MCELLHTSAVVQKMMGSQCPATARGWSLFSALFAAALAQPTNGPSGHERGQQERDDHAHADKHVGENYSGAALDGHDARRRFASMPLYGQSSGSPRGFNALSCFNVRLDWPAPGVIYTPCFCILPSEAARTINLRSSRSKRLATVRNSYANSSKAALLSSSLVL